MGLEEAGIIWLKDAKGGAATATATAAAATTTTSSLEPNGVGAIGKLDVGWLNSRSSKVEREMEAELWERARAQLETKAGVTAGA